MACIQCGRAVAPGISWCDHCKSPVGFSAAEDERMSVDIRARILWGEAAEEIRADWQSKGAPAAAVQEALASAGAERRRHFRRRGTQDLLMGLGAFLLAALCLGWGHAEYHGQIRMTRVEKLMLVGIIGGTTVGLFMTLRGTRRLLTGGPVGEAASDLSDFE